MILHVFNPEHDIALAANMTNFTAPFAGRALRADLGFIPALWANEGDAILVEDVDEACERYQKLTESVGIQRKKLLWLTKTKVSSLVLDGVDPWGWDLAIRSQLLRYGVKESLLPSTDEIGAIRNMSHRKLATDVLRQLQQIGVVGEAYCCYSLDEIETFIHNTPNVVLKAPWSSSGRGIRFVHGELTSTLRGWIDNLLHSQGSVMLEPFYEKVMDFAMEFSSDGAGSVTYHGLSLFATVNGAYTGNLLASEEEKEDMLSAYVSIELLRNIRGKITSLTSSMFLGKYSGPFGVDMMACKGGLLHPCVEINLRRTMGHVALSLSPYKKGRLAVCGKSPFQLLVE